MSKPPIPVVCALIENQEGQVLVAQRPAHKHTPLKWEFAGGKVEAGESPSSALTREIREELGCDIVVGTPLQRFTYVYSDVTIEMIPFLCTLAKGSAAPHPHEHVQIRWVSKAELGSIDLAPADWPVVDTYRELTRS